LAGRIEEEAGVLRSRYFATDVGIVEDEATGAAAVLINQTHTHTDLVLAVNALEKRLIDAVDGSRRLGEIVEDALPDNPARLETGRRFFERLWLHDHVAIGAA
jgi:hypothetical protein